MRGVVAVDHSMVLTTPRVNSAPSFCWRVSHPLRGVLAHAGLKRICLIGLAPNLGFVRGCHPEHDNKHAVICLFLLVRILV